MRKGLPCVLSLLALFSFFVPTLIFAQTPEQKARQYLLERQKDWHATAEDLSDIFLLSELTDEHNGVTHLYFQQRSQGIAIKGAELNFSFDQSGKLVNAGGVPLGQLTQRINTYSPQITGASALRLAAQENGIVVPVVLQPQKEPEGPALNQVFSAGGFVLEDVPVQLSFFPEQETIHLAWEVWLYTLDAQHYWQVWVDALTGKVLASGDHVNSCFEGESAHMQFVAVPAGPLARPMAIPQYRVYPLPVETPLFGGRSLLVDPSDPIASPYGWHDTNGATGEEYTYARGNNVYAYTDLTNNNSANSANSAAGGTTLNFDFALDLTQAPSTYRPAAVTNLFYMNNILHDVLYQYGFNEASGNFQVNNYGNGGTANDEVRAEAQDGGGNNNANFSTPADGSRPRMQMYLWNYSTPGRDGDLDNGIIAHEYGHGVSNRLTGGRLNVSCLQNNEQMGEGWSDYIALMLTMKPTDVATKRRGIGNYVINQDTNGVGIRPYPYTTDMAVNLHTYNSIKSVSIPHGIGSVWCEMLWEMTWALIDVYGFDSDIYQGTGGNNLALQLVMDGMKLQPCSPGFIDGRNAILKADSLNNGAANSCLIWAAFAKRGLGFSATQGLSSSVTDGVEAFDVPPVCNQVLKVKVSASPDPVPAGQILTYTLKAKNSKASSLTDVVLFQDVTAGSTYVAGSASNGGSLTGNTLSFPGVSLAAGDSVIRTFQVQVDNAPFTQEYLNDPAETNTNWSIAGTGTPNWVLSSTGPHLGSKSWFAVNASSVTDFKLELSSSFSPVAGTELSFWHKYDLESTFDGGVVEISTDNGGTWQDLETYMTTGSYNATLSNQYNNPLAGRRAFTGAFTTYAQVKIDLTPFAGQNVKIRFRLGTDSTVGKPGWNVDDILISHPVYLDATACATSLEGDNVCTSIGNGTLIIAPVGTLPVEALHLLARPDKHSIELTWTTASELQNAGFVVERRSESEKAFQNLGFVAGGGNTFSPRSYRFSDHQALAGVRYTYRLRQRDVNGTEHISQLVEARLAAFAAIQVFPNPATDKVTVEVGAYSGTTICTLTNLQGKTVLTKPFMGQQPANGWEIGLSTLPSGLYYLKIDQAGTIETHKLAIKR